MTEQDENQKPEKMEEALPNLGSGGEAGNWSGLRMLIDKNSTAQTRLPMLEVVFDRLVRLLSNSYRSFTSFTVDVEIESTTYMKFGEYIDNLPMPTIISLVRAVEWENLALLTVDSALTYSLVEVLFGGRKAASNIKVEGRPYTSIEQSVAQSIVEIFLNDLSVAFEPVTPVTFQLDRIEINPKFAAIVRSDDIISILRLQVKMEARSGYIDLVIPYSTLEPVKKVLQKSFLGERGTRDPYWIHHIEQEIGKTSVNLSVKLNGITSTVKDLANLQVGHTIILDKAPEDDIFVTIDGLKVSIGTIGRVNDKVAIKLLEPINVNKDKG